MASSASPVTRRPATALDTVNSRPSTCPEIPAVCSASRRAVRLAGSRLPALAPAGAVASSAPDVSATAMPAAPLPENSGCPAEPSSATPLACAVLAAVIRLSAMPSSVARLSRSAVRVWACPASLPDESVMALPASVKASVPSPFALSASAAALPPLTSGVGPPPIRTSTVWSGP